MSGCLDQPGAAGARWAGRGGLRSGALHGEMEQRERNRVMGLLRSGQIDILVATDLAARGLTNRAVATELAVSVKAVEWHLSHVYRKLGISSRLRLPGAMGLSSVG